MFVALELGLVALLGAGMYVLAGTRAYASGETFWSNAQNEAVLHLSDYAVAHRASDYDAYLADLGVAFGDRDARAELESASPDMGRAREALIRGGNQPEDIDTMVWLFRTFRNAPPIQGAVAAWIDADASIDRLQSIVAELHMELNCQTPDQTRLDNLRDQLDAVNTQASQDGNRFAAAIAETARLVQTALIWGAVGGGGLLLGLGSAVELLNDLDWGSQIGVELRKILSQEIRQSACSIGRSPTGQGQAPRSGGPDGPVRRTVPARPRGTRPAGTRHIAQATCAFVGHSDASRGRVVRA